MANDHDYSKVFYVEPNYNTQAEERINTPYYLHDMEDYCIYVDLEVEIYDRNVEGMNGTHTLLFSWKTNRDGSETASFLSGSKIRYGGENGTDGFQVLTTNYMNTHYDDIVGDNTTEQSQNPELFGIKSIDIDYNNYAVPQVEITFTDIRGTSLFGPEEFRHRVTQNGIGGFSDDDIAGSFFKCFFTFPYPKFTLRVKGFYGQGVSYELTCAKFTTKFDSQKGNFDATASFVGYSYSLLNDITLNAVLAAPLSDYLGKEYWVSRGGSLTETEIGDTSLSTSGDSSGAFTIADPNGKLLPMPTFNRILSVMDNLIDVRSKLQDTDPDAYRAANNNDTYIRQLKRVMSLYDTYCQEVINKLQEKYQGYVYIQYTNNDGSSCDAIGKQVAGIAAFIESNTTNPLDVADVPVEKYNYQIGQEMVNIGSTKTIPNPKVWQNVINSENKISNNEPFKNLNVIKEKLSETLAEQPYKFSHVKHAYVFDGTSFCSGVNMLIQQLTNEKMAADKKIAAIDEQAISEVLGFVPTVDNVMAILMAHLETVLYIIYNATNEVAQINSTPDYRKLSDFGISNGDLTGLKIKDDEMVPAWPKIVEKDSYSQKWVDAWIGDFPKNGEVQPEANAVNGLLNGIKHVQVSIDEAANALNNGTSGGTTYIACKSRVALPLVPSDLLSEGNPFGTDTLANDSFEHAYDDLISKMFTRMWNVCMVDNVRPYVQKGMTSNIRDSIMEDIGSIDAINFFTKYKDQLPSTLKQYILSADFDDKGKDILQRMQRKSDFWRNNKAVEESQYELCDYDNPFKSDATNNCVSVSCHWRYVDINKMPSVRQNVSITDYLTNGKNSPDSNYYGSDILVLVDNVHLFDNVEQCYSETSLKMENCRDETGKYESLFEYMFGNKYCKYDGSEVFGDGKHFRFDNDDNKYATYDKNFCLKRTADGTNVVAYTKGSGNIPLAPREIGIAQSESIIPVSSRIDADEVIVKTEDGTANKERAKVNNKMLKQIPEYEDINESDFTVPTVQFYDSGDWSFWGNRIPSSGVTLFSAPEYYACINNHQRAFLFLDNLMAHDVGHFLEKLKSTSTDASSVFIYTTKVNVLLLGAYIYMDYFDDLFFEGIDDETKKILKEKINSKRDELDATADDIEGLNNLTRDKLWDYFEKWAETDFLQYDEQFALKLKGGERFKKADCEKFIDIIKTGNEWELSEFVDGNFYRNYSKVCYQGALFFREDADIVKRLTSFTVKPILVVNNYFNTSVNENRDDNISGGGDISDYVAGFANKLKDLVDGQNRDEVREVVRGQAKEPNTAKDVQIALYKYLKLVHDKWLGSTSFESWRMENFYKERFAYIDSYYYDIGDKVFINPTKMCDLICRSEADKGFSLISFITTMLQENNLAFMCVQNFLKLKTADSDRTGQLYVDAMRDMFEPIAFLDMKHMEDKPFFVTIYKGEPSSNLNIKGSEYVDDSFMLNYSNSELWPEAINNKNEQNGYPIPAFGVTYGSQYQSYFTDVNVGMDSSMVTEQSLQAQYMIASMNSKTGGESANDKENGTSAFALGQDLYTIYSNNSYTCNVTMMGCAWVQPLMYFVLLNVPLFRGSYLIEKVKHSITPGNMVTTITGVRMANTLTPFVKSPFYMQGETLDSSYANAYYPESACAGVDNDCQYAVYPVGRLSADGGFSEALLKESGGFGKYGLVTSKDTFTERYDTLIEALTCTVIAECGSKDKLAAQLVATVLFNRVKNKGDFHIFRKGQIAYTHATSSTHPDGYDKVYDWVMDVFVNTPMVLVGETTKVINPVSIYNHNEKAEQKTSPVKITKEMVQSMYMYCTRQGYDESNTNDGKDHITNKDLETQPSDWRKQTYLCHHDHSSIYGHVFTTGDGDKTYWEAKQEKKNDVDTVEEDGMTKLVHDFIDALNQTVEATGKINGKVVGRRKEDAEPNCCLLSMTNKAQMNTLFDIICNAYPQYVARVEWICANEGSISSNDYPDEIYVRVVDGTAKQRQIGVSYADGSQYKRIARTDSSVSQSYFKTLNKLYKASTTSGLKNVKTDCPQFAGMNDSDILSLLTNGKITSCQQVMPHPKPGSSSKNWSIGGSKIGSTWEALIKGGLLECGCTKSKEELKAAIDNLFDGAKPASPEEVEKYLADFELQTTSGVKKIRFHKKLGADLVKAFAELYELKFPVYAVHATKWRYVQNPDGTPNYSKRSNHSYGIAIDINGINPNPYYKRAPSAAEYGTDIDGAGVIRTVNSAAVKVLKKYGFGWGGYYGDTMHFSYFNGR